MKNLLSIITFCTLTFISTSQIVQLGQDIDGLAGDQSGYCVSLNYNGSRVAIGSPFNNSIGNVNGAVRIYEFNGVSWVQLGQSIYGIANDNLGNSVALDDDGNRVVIGAANAIGGLQDGTVQVYEFDGANWNQVGQTILYEADNDQFGVSVDISGNGNRIIAGSRRNSDGGASAGHARVFDFNGTNWTQLGQDLDGTAQENFGQAVCIDPSGTVVAIGGANNGSGVVREYRLDVNTWNQVGIDLIGDQVGDKFGSSLSLSNDGLYLVVGAPLAGSVNQGSVKVFSGTNLIQVGQTIFGENNGDQIGGQEAVAIDIFGNKLIIGSRFNDGNGISSGQARLFTFDNVSWIQSGVVYGEIAGDQMGQVSISSDGQRIALGARENSDAGNIAGHARIYDLGDVGINELNPVQISVFPNPSNGIINFKSNENITMVEVLDISGRKVGTYEYNNQINFHLTEGMYLLNFLDNDRYLGNVRIEIQ